MIRPNTNGIQRISMKSACLERLHADVMIEIVDLVQVLAIQSAALDLVRKNVEIEPVGILGRDQMHFPERKEQRDANRHCGCKEQQA